MALRKQIILEIAELVGNMTSYTDWDHLVEIEGVDWDELWDELDVVLPEIAEAIREIE